MNGGLVYGLLDTSSSMADPRVAARLRDLTITWSRYDYHGPIIERATIDAILARAAEQGFRYCFIQGYGQIIPERWDPGRNGGPDFRSALIEWVREQRLLAAGRILSDGDGGYGLDPRCLLVDVAAYVQCGRPSFGDPDGRSRELPTALEIGHDGHIAALQPSGRSRRAVPGLPGWGLVRASLHHGIPVLTLPTPIREHVLDLRPGPSADANGSDGASAGGLDPAGSDDGAGERDRPQAAFLASVRLQAENARRGVFLWNLEAYHDVETPPPGFAGPVSTLYAVAAGFKPNRILQTHGMDPETRVVFFDYSAQALAVRRTMVEEWDGEDFPRFARGLLDRFPPSGTFYQGGADARPDTIDWTAFRARWDREVGRLGGPAVFREHWRRYRALPHTYVRGDVLVAAAPLLAHVRREPRAVMWFSNAPFTVYGNWLHPPDVRRARYVRWIEQLAERNPDMLLYGSDYNNSNVNCITAGEYWRLYQERDGGPLEPAHLYEHEVRM